MELGNPGWLSALLDEELAAHRPDPALVSSAVTLKSGRRAARAYLRRVLRESGLLYGTPATRTSPSPTERQRAPEELLFIAVLRTFIGVALNVADLTTAPGGPRKEQLLLLLAAQVGDLKAVTEIHRWVAEVRAPPLKLRLYERVEEALAARAVSLAGDPAYGLVLHNGAVYADAQLFGRQAIAYFSHGRLTAAEIGRRLEFSARTKALLTEVLTALSCIERSPSFPARRAILRQVEDLRLPADIEDELRTRVKRFFERPPKIKELVRHVRSKDARTFLLEQTLLASLVNGHRSPGEIAFVHELAKLLGVSSKELGQIELSVAEFYAKNREVVDVFTVSAGAGLMGEELVESIQRTVEKNVQRLLQEVKETGELSVLLSKAARGRKLTPEERNRMREQLIDVAKAIPALAIFAAPGGMLLLIALAKVLPFNLLPSSFQDSSPDE